MRHAYLRILCLLCIISWCVKGLAQPSWGDLVLPTGVNGEIVSYNDGQMEIPFDKIDFSVHRDWVRSVQYVYQAGLGWSLFDFTQDTFDKSVLYHPDTYRGTIDKRLDTMGYSRADVSIGPIGWVRTLHVLKDHGQTIKVTQQNSNTVYSADMALGQGIIRVFVDSKGRIPRVELDNPKTSAIETIYTYSDWQPIGTHGKEYPYTIHTLITPPSGPPLDHTGVIKTLSLLPPDAAPPAMKFPKNAIFADNIEHVKRNGAMKITGKLDVSTPAQSSNPAALTRSTVLDISKQTWLIMLAVALFVFAAIIREVRRRKAQE